LGKVEGYEEVKVPIGAVSAFEMLSEEGGSKEVYAFSPTARWIKRAFGHIL